MKTRLRQGKFQTKKERAGGRQNGEGNGEIWDLKYKNSEDTEIKLEKCNNWWAKFDKGVERIRVF